MVERTIRAIAKELAARDYEKIRSCESLGEKAQIEIRGRVGLITIEATAFGKTFPTLKDYWAGRYHGIMVDREGCHYHIDDGSVRYGVPCWLHYYEQARQCNLAVMSNPNTHENIRDGAYRAHIEDREKQLAQEARGERGLAIPQRKLH